MMSSTPTYRRRSRDILTSPTFTSTLFAGHSDHTSSPLDPLLKDAYMQTTAFVPSHDDLCLDTLRCSTSQALYPPNFVGPNFQAIHDDLCVDTLLCATPPEPFLSGLGQQQHAGPLHPLSVHPPLPRQSLPLHSSFLDSTMQNRPFSTTPPPEPLLSGFAWPPAFQASRSLNPMEAGGSSSDGGVDDDSTSILSACSVGDICCQGEECRDDDTACNDQTCFQMPQDFTQEVTSAAEALTSFMPTPSMPGGQQQFSMYSGEQGQGQQQQSYRPSPAGSMAPTMMSRQYMPYWEHLIQSHRPQDPPCPPDMCLLQEPDFWAHCHVNMWGDSSMSGTEECAVASESGNAMVYHIWQHHLGQDIPTETDNGSLEQAALEVPGSSASDSPQSLLQQGSWGDISLPAPLSISTRVSEPSQTRAPLSAKSDETQTLPGSEDTETSDIHRCLWCEADASDPCGVVFADKESLKNHYESHTENLAKDESKKFPCKWLGCPRQSRTPEEQGFRSRGKLILHLDGHIAYKSHKCAECGLLFSSKQALSQHEHIHRDEKPEECPICHVRMRAKSALTMHMRTHSKSKPLKCDICQKPFSESSNLAKHRKTHGPPMIPCLASGCTKHFHRRDQCYKHMAAIHSLAKDGTPLVKEEGTPKKRLRTSKAAAA